MKYVRRMSIETNIQKAHHTSYYSQLETGLECKIIQNLKNGYTIIYVELNHVFLIQDISSGHYQIVHLNSTIFPLKVRKSVMRNYGWQYKNFKRDYQSNLDQLQHARIFQGHQH